MSLLIEEKGLFDKVQVPIQGYQKSAKKKLRAADPDSVPER